MNFLVTPAGRFDLGYRTAPCALGRGGVRPAADKREGDGATPAGAWPIRRVLYRADRLTVETILPLEALQPDDGWCDDPADPAYNRPVRRPYPASSEAMWRDDQVYDIVIVLGHNDDPPVAGLGSCIFLHLARDGYPPTEGCVALALEDMQSFLASVRPGDTVWISAS